MLKSLVRSCAALTALLVVGGGAIVNAAGGPGGGGGGGLPDLVVGISATPAVVQPGAALVWTVNVGNIGTAAAGAFMVLIPSTAGFGATGAGWSCTSSVGSRSGPARTLCSTTGLAAGASSAFTIAATAVGTAGTYSISATADPVVFGATVAESNETNNDATGSFVVPVNGPFDFVARHLVSSADPTLPSEPVTYTTTVDNIGLYPGFTTVTLTDALPVGFTFVSWTATVQNGLVFASPGSVSCVPAGDPATGVTVTCTGVPNSSFGSPQGGSVTIVAQPPAAVGLVDYVATDTVSVDSDNVIPESNETNNTATGVRRITNMLPDLAVAMTTSPTPVAPGGVITHDITVTNTGTGNAPTAVVAFGPLAGTWIGGGANGFTCGVLFTTRSGSVMGCTMANLAAGASVTFPLQLTASGLVGTTTTAANVYVVGTRQEVPGPDNVAQTTATIAVAGAVDLSVAVTTTSPVAVHQPTSLFVTVTNSGIGLAAATTVETVLPDGFVFTSGSSSAGLCTATGQVVSCPILETAPKRTQSLVVNTTTPAAGGAFSSTVTVDPAGLVAESDETNNSTVVPITVSGAFADLTTTITGPATSPTNGKPVYSVTVANTGNATADAPAVTLRESGFVKIDSVTAPAGWTCLASRIKTIVFCNGGSLASGDTVTFQVTVAGAPARGVATSFSSAVDPGNAIQELSETNNTASFTTTVV